MNNPYLPQGQEPQYYFLKLLAAIVRKSGGSLVLEPQWLDSVGQGNCIIPIWDSLAQQLILKFSTEPLPVFALGASNPSQPPTPLQAPSLVPQQPKSPVPPSQRHQQPERMPRMLDDAALVELENRKLRDQALADLLAPQAES
jgi:hypothetical protein